MKLTNEIAQTTNDKLFEQVEAQLRAITNNLEQLGLDAVPRERLISLTFIDIWQELA